MDTVDDLTTTTVTSTLVEDPAETDHSHDEDDDEMTDASIRQTYFQCPPCGAKFSNATGAWQHFFMWHDEDIRMKEVRTWRKRVAIESDDDDDDDSPLDDPPSNHSTETEGLESSLPPPPNPNFYETETPSVNPDSQSHPRQLRASRKPKKTKTAKAKEPKLHLEAGKRKCPDCCEIVSSHLSRHALVHVDASLPCPHCGGAFAKQYQLIRHVEKVHYEGYLEWREKHGRNKDDERIQCSDCSELLVDKYRYRMHQAMHRAGRLSCPMGCRGKFSETRRLSAHLRSSH